MPETPNSSPTKPGAEEQVEAALLPTEERIAYLLINGVDGVQPAAVILTLCHLITTSEVPRKKGSRAAKETLVEAILKAAQKHINEDEVLDALALVLRHLVPEKELMPLLDRCRSPRVKVALFSRLFPKLARAVARSTK